MQFTDSPDVPDLKASTLLNASEAYEQTAEGDKDFVYYLMRAVFGTDLATKTLTGMTVVNKVKVFTDNKLDSRKLDYVYMQHAIRARALGINPDDRHARQQRSTFNEYARMVIEVEHKKWKSQVLKDEASKAANDTDGNDVQ